MQSLGFHAKNPMMFEMVLKISTKRKGGSATFVQLAEDLAELIVSQSLRPEPTNNVSSRLVGSISSD